MKTIYNIKSSIKYPKANEKGEMFNLKNHKQDIENAIEKFNQKHNGSKKLTLKGVDENAIQLILESANRLKEDNIGKELTYFSRVLKSEYGWGQFSKYDSSFLHIDELERQKNVKKEKDVEVKVAKRRGRPKKNANIENIEKSEVNNESKVEKKTRVAKKTNVKKSSNDIVSKVVSMGKEMVRESFNMSLSEFLVMKNETKVVDDMKEIVVNLENMISLLDNEMKKEESTATE